MSNIVDSKRIAKNTILLYGRMLLTMLIQLYTSRVVLNTLGVEDFGIYNVVGGVVTMFAFLNLAMNSSTQRYLTFYLGKQDEDTLKKVFVHCYIVHIIIAAIVILLAETVGLWFLYNKMIIPVERMTAAFWVYQCSIVSTVLLIFTTPYNADIIAHERMSVFAYVSIAEVTLKLLIVFLLWIIDWDKLILYAILLVLVQFIIRQVYKAYCNRKFDETRLVWSFDKSMFREMLSFVGWNVFGGLSNVLYSQGLNILLNVFFGPIVNAARGIAVQVQNAILQFSQNFQTAINPQITKSYSAGELDNMHNLIFKSSRYTFYLLWILSVPVFLEADFLLMLWLGIVPEWTVIFLRIMLCIIIIDSVANPLMISSAATGKVKVYQLVVGGIMLLVLPVSYVFLKLGFEPYSVFIVHFCICIIAFIARIIIVKGLINLSLREYFNNVFINCLIVGAISLFPVALVKFIWNDNLHPILMILLSVLAVAISVFFVGLTNGERNLITTKVKSFVLKK